MKKYLLVVSILSVFFSFPSLFSQKIYVLHDGEDSTTVNGETIALETIFDISGFEYTMKSTSNIKNIYNIENYDVLFLFNQTKNSTSEIIEVECNKLLAKGGLVFADYYSTLLLESIFGVRISVDKVDIHQKIILDEVAIGGGMSWLNDSLEQVIPMCKEGKSSFVVWELEPISAIPIAYYEDSTVAITCKNQGDGKAYFFGPSWKRLVVFPRNNNDYTAERTYSNGFEPGADIVPLLIRGIIEDHCDASVWKHTLPYDYQSVLMVTHDVDATTGYDTAHYFIEHEKENNIPGHYFLTTKYFDDDISGPFYTQSEITTGKEVLNKVYDAGLTVGSHSVGHFPDFDDDERFPLGSIDVNKEAYSPFSNGEITSGGSVLGEFLVSKQIIEEDGGREIKSFRSGHLVFNENQAEGLVISGYTVESSFSANDVMTGFPYFLQKGQSSSQSTVDVLEIPLHISDVIDDIDVDNYMETVDLWQSVLERYDDNYAPVCLLVHPTRMFKIAAVDSLIRRTKGKTDLVDFSAMNDFWRARYNLNYRTNLDNGILTITVPDSVLPIASSLSLHITKGQALDFIIVKSSVGMDLDHTLLKWNEDDYLLRFESKIKDFEWERKRVAAPSVYIDFSFNGTAQLDFDSVLWNFGDGDVMMSLDSREVTHVYSTPGYYDVMLTVWHNGIETVIEKNSIIYVSDVTNVLSGFGEVSDCISVMPNPTTGFITLKIDNVWCKCSAEFYDMQGRKLSQVFDVLNPISVPISRGMCFLKVNVDGEVYLRKIIKL